MDRAGAQHDALGTDIEPVVLDAGPNAGGTTRLDEHPVHSGAADDTQVRALARRLQVGVVGRDPGAVARVEPEWRDPRGGGRVVVFAPRIAESERSIRERVVCRPPRFARQALNRDRPVRPVVGPVAEVGVALHPLQVGEHVGVRPTWASGRRPAVVVVRYRADGHHPVHRRTAAEAPPPHMRPRLLGAGAPRLEPPPLERSARRLVQRPPAVEAAQLRRRLARPPVRTGLQKHDVLSRILAQASGEHAPGAAAADDNPVRLDSDAPTLDELTTATARRPRLEAGRAARAPPEACRACSRIGRIRRSAGALLLMVIEALLGR